MSSDAAKLHVGRILAIIMETYHKCRTLEDAHPISPVRLPAKENKSQIIQSKIRIKMKLIKHRNYS